MDEYTGTKLITMEKILQRQLLALFFLMALFTGCDISGPAPTSLTQDQVWGNSRLIEFYMDDLYKAMGHGLHEIMVSSLTDESEFIHGYGTFNSINLQITSSYFAAWENDIEDPSRLDDYQWENLYDKIGQINLLIENIDDSAIQDESLIRQMKAEAFFIRAFIYHKFLKNYGGVPIIERSFGLDDELQVPRNTFEETVRFIVEETEKASEILPLEPRKPGYATKGAALALKSRVLLYAASDLYNENPANEYVGYLSGNRQNRWEEARDAAREVMDLGVYELYDRHSDPVENFTQLFLANEGHEEAIMSRFFDSNDTEDGYHPGLHNGPNGYRNWGGNTPVLSLVNAFQMKDGTEFDWENPDHKAAPFENRDPRFYATILYDGAEWRERPVGARQRDPQGIIQTFSELKLPNGDVLPGLDTRNGPIEEWNGSYTGFYLRKFMDPSHEPLVRSQEVPWRYFRYAEILLNYAEASIELGEEGEARQAINRIRQRAGMPEITSGGEELLRQYRNERRVELAFEDHRYWDIRRWKIAPEVYHGADVVTITVEATDPYDRETYFNYEYTGSNTPSPPADEFYSGRRLDGQWSWDDRAYFLPIPLDELNRNEQLVQNPGY